MVKSVQEKRTTDSSVEWLNYNKTGRIYICSKMSCTEEKKRREELLIVLLRQTPRGEKKRTRQREREKKERIESRLFT
jgi:ribose 1,5-bisphosphokinase PhnN